MRPVTKPRRAPRPPATTTTSAGAAVVEAYSSAGDLLFSTPITLTGFCGVSGLAINDNLEEFVVLVEECNRYVPPKSRDMIQTRDHSLAQLENWDMMEARPIQPATDDPHRVHLIVHFRFANEQIQHRGLQIAMEHPTVGDIPQVASPIKYEGEELAYDRAPPPLGHDTAEVLVGVAGLTEEEIAALRESGVAG